MQSLEEGKKRSVVVKSVTGEVPEPYYFVYY